MTDRADATVVTWQPVGTVARRLVFEPTDGGQYRREEQIQAGDSWRTIGVELVGEVSIENAAEVADE